MSRKLKDNHHIIPQSRCKALGINPKFAGNVVQVSTSKHRAWHILFGNKTPTEAIAQIEVEWSLSVEAEALFEKLSGNVVLMERKAKTQKIGGNNR